MNNFDRLNDWIRDTENSIVNFLSAFAPWLAPLVPAYMTYQHAVGTLGFPQAVAIPAALVVEILGFSAVSTYLAFWFYNRRNPAASKQAPVILVIIAFGFYLVLIVFSNVLLDSFPGERWAEITVRALFTLQTIPAAMLVSVRTQHRELLSEIAKEKRERSETRERTNTERTGQEKRSERTENERTTNSVAERIEQFVLETYNAEQRIPGATETANKLGVSKGYASDTIKYVLSKHGNNTDTGE